MRNGHIKRITDNDIQSLVIEIAGTNVRLVNLLFPHFHLIRICRSLIALDVTLRLTAFSLLLPPPSDPATNVPRFSAEVGTINHLLIYLLT